mgnify:CR=1 FL=1
MFLRFFSIFILFFPSFSGAAEISVLELTRKMDNLYRSDSAEAELTMAIQTPDWLRELKVKSFSQGLKTTLIRILSPAKDRGVATLRVEQEMWNFFPKINKVMKIPPSMMMGSWMGSDFTNDDLVRQVSLESEYDGQVKTTNGKYVLTLVPKKNTATVWGKIETTIDRTTLLPDSQMFYDEKNQKIREMQFSEVRDFDGRKFPAVMKLISVKKPGNSTTIRYDSLRFNTKPDPSLFTLRKLQERF